MSRPAFKPCDVCHEKGGGKVRCRACGRQRQFLPRGSSVEQYFLSKVRKADGDSCWLWTGALRGNRGYGHYTMKGKRHMKAHKASYLIFVGPVPKGLDVCHTCDVRLCVRPSHLFLDTRKGNLHDMIRKGRKKSKLTIPQVLEIRRRIKMGEEASALAKEYGVSKPTTYRIGRGLQWASLA